MTSYKQHCSGIFFIVSFGLFIIIIFIRRWLINSSPDQIAILRGVIVEVDEILSELSGGEGDRNIVLLPRGRLADGHQ